MFICASALKPKKHTTEQQLTFWFSEQHNPQSQCKADVSSGRAAQQLFADWCCAVAAVHSWQFILNSAAANSVLCGESTACGLCTYKAIVLRCSLVCHT